MGTQPSTTELSNLESESGGGFVINGVDVTQLNFDPPSAFDEVAGAGSNCDTLPASCVFHPQGGGAIPVTAPAAVTNSGGQVEYGIWEDRECSKFSIFQEKKCILVVKLRMDYGEIVNM